MQNQQSNLQGQTGQPAPSARDPQASTNSNLQQALDLQNIDSSQSTITVPGSDKQSIAASSSQSGATENTTSPLVSFDVGTPLLVTVFIAAVVIISLLVKLAKPKHELYPETDHAGERDPLDSQATGSQVNTSTAVQKKTTNKKMTRRQRRALGSNVNK
jgi:hypothetical protein